MNSATSAQRAEIWTATDFGDAVVATDSDGRTDVVGSASRSFFSNEFWALAKLRKTYESMKRGIAVAPVRLALVRENSLPLLPNAAKNAS